MRIYQGLLRNTSLNQVSRMSFMGDKMKKILIIGMLIISTYIYANDFRFYSFGEFAYYPMKEDYYTSEENTYFSTNIGIGMEYKFLFVDVNQFVDVTKSRSFYFSPYREKYYVTAGFNFWIMQIGYQHLCTHTIDNRNRYRDQYDKIYISFDTRKLK